MLKLIIDNTLPPYRKGQVLRTASKVVPFRTPIKTSFAADFQKISRDLYILRVQDFDHALACEMVVELKERFTTSYEESRHESYLAPVITCTIPNIHTARLNEIIDWDEYLQGSLLIQFQLKILEQLLLFCDSKDAINLILSIDELNNDYVDIYRPFFIADEQVITSTGLETEIVIPADLESFDDVIDFMDEIDEDFRQNLWRNQKTNPAFRKYLIHHTLSLQ